MHSIRFTNAVYKNFDPNISCFTEISNKVISNKVIVNNFEIYFRMVNLFRWI